MKQSRVEMEYVPIETIKPYEHNPRVNAEAVPMLAKSIDDFGFLVPIVIDKDGVIAAGHTRYLASMELGLKEVPVIRAKDLTPKQIKAFRLADNKVAELAGWDFDLLNIELDDLGDDFDMEDYGFILDEYDPFKEDEDVVNEDVFTESDKPPVEKPTVDPDPSIEVKSGDTFALGRHILYCGAIKSRKDLEHLLQGKVPSLAFSEPSVSSLDNIGDSVDFMLDCGVVNVAVVYPLTDKNKPSFARLLGERSKMLKTIVYRARPQELKSPGRLMPAIDPIPVFSVEDRTDVFAHDPGSWTGLVNCKDPWTPHLATSVIEALTDEKDTVLDLYGEMGYTLIACEDLGRTCVIAETSPENCAIIISEYIAHVGSRDSVFLVRDGKKRGLSR